jgi:predicted hotdog family 3-hydroxylacyl-ACP dehydratase
LIENIAQTCAARIGYINKYILKKEIQIGFIGAIRNLQVHTLPDVEEIIYTEIDVQEEVFGMILVTAIVKTTKYICAEAELKIAIKE